MSTGLVLRDIHQPPAPAWWPPAPGWWLVAGGLAVGVAVLWWWRRRKRLHEARVMAVFDTALAGAATPGARVAAMSELLRRAARRRDPAADRLEGEAWLAHLDGAHGDGFVTGPGRLLLEGPYRPDVTQAEAADLEPLARARFRQWMGLRR